MAQIVLVAGTAAATATISAAATLWIIDQTDLAAPPRRSEGVIATVQSTASPTPAASPAVTEGSSRGPTGVQGPVARPVSPRPSETATAAAASTSPSPSAGERPPSTAPATPAVPASIPSNRPVPIDARLAQVVIRPWVDEFGQTRAQVVAQVTNRSVAAVTFRPSAYRVLDDGGREVAHGTFSHVFPPVVAPGGHGYMVDNLRVVFARVGDLARVTTTVSAAAASPEAVQRAKDLHVEALKWSTGEGGGLRVSGMVRNAGGVEQTDVATAVVLFGRDDDVLGLVYDLTDASTVRPGPATPFDTEYPGTAPADPNDVRRVEGMTGSLATD